MPREYKLISPTKRGLYCERADIYIDPWKPVDKAIVTHAHADHARYGHSKYLAHINSEPVLRYRLGKDINLQTLEYNQPININGVEITLFPAGHVIGSAQVRVSYKGETWVISGDYKLEDDGISTPFEPVKCDVFVTEATFGLPVFKWRPQAEVIREIEEWWHQNQAAGRASLLTAYSLGKAQRLLANLNQDIGPILTHGSIWNTNKAFRDFGIKLPADNKATIRENKHLFSKGLILGPGSAMRSNWVKRFGKASTAAASGWMQIRGIRRRRALDRGFVLSDHADWDDLNTAVNQTGAELVYVTHGYTEQLSRWLNDRGIMARPLPTEFGDTE